MSARRPQRLSIQQILVKLSSCLWEVMVAQHLECRLMHGYVLGFPVIAEIDVDLPKSIATTSRDPRFHLSEFQSGPTSM